MVNVCLIIISSSRAARLSSSRHFIHTLCRTHTEQPSLHREEKEEDGEGMAIAALARVHHAGGHAWHCMLYGILLEKASARTRDKGDAALGRFASFCRFLRTLPSISIPCLNLAHRSLVFFRPLNPPHSSVFFTLMHHPCQEERSIFGSTMIPLSREEISRYSCSPVHYAVASKDYVSLRRIVSSLPKLATSDEICTDIEAVAEEKRAEVVSAVLDRRDVPGRETALHLAVRMGDAVAAEILMAAGIDWSLQNEQGWSALQEAICAREDAIAMVIMRYYQPMAWAKWCRRVPRVIAVMQKMRDFYMELTFHFESSVIPFIGRIAPSDTYRIWKRGSNLRADMTLAGFDGFRIQRSDESFLFLGEGSADGKIPPGSLYVLNHKNKEITNALARAATKPTDTEIAQEVAAMLQTSIYRPGIDVTEAELLPQLTWRRQEKTEMVGQWKAKLYDMHHVVVSVKSRRVSGAVIDDEPFGISEINGVDDGVENFTGILTEDERKQLQTALKMEYTDVEEDNYGDGKVYFGISNSSIAIDELKEERSRLSLSRLDLNVEEKKDKKSWFSWGRRSFRQDGQKKIESSRHSLFVSGKSNDPSECNSGEGPMMGRHQAVHKPLERRFSDFGLDESYTRRSDKDVRSLASKEQSKRRRVYLNMEGNDENEYKKGLRPVLWLTRTFPLRTEELLPLLDILASKVKAISRLRELLTTKLPAGTFPVKVAIPVVPTIRVLVTFSKFEELNSVDVFATPPSSPAHLGNMDGNSNVDVTPPSGSWLSWIKGSANRVSRMSNLESKAEGTIDPFLIPADYTWTTTETKNRKSTDKQSKATYDSIHGIAQHKDNC